MDTPAKKIHRFLCAAELSGETIEIKDSTVIHQVGRVLALRPGEKIAVCQMSEEWVGEILDIVDDRLTLKLLEKLPARQPPRHVTLYAAILKKDNFETAVRLATEAGVTDIIPVVSRRTVKLDVRLDRLEKIVRESAEQCGRCAAPSISEPLNFAAALQHASVNGLNVILDAGGEPWKDVGFGRHERVGIFIGPEGGWDQEEVTAALGRGFSVTNLGEFILRGETAVAVASWLAVNVPEE